MKKNEVKLGIVDNRLQCNIKTYKLDESGDKIEVFKEDSGLNPKISPNGYLLLPNSKWAFWKPRYEKTYLVSSYSTECYNFPSNTFKEFDPKAILDAANNRILRNMGTEETKTPYWVYILAFLMIIVLIAVLR